MPVLHEREKALEEKFERQQEFAFKVTARRNKLFGLWAAGHMGLVGEGAARYAMELVDSEVLRRDDEAVVARLCADLIGSGFPITRADLRRKLKGFEQQAKTELARGT